MALAYRLLLFILPIGVYARPREPLGVADLNLPYPPLVPQGGKFKGDAGKIGVIGGSVEIPGAPYFTAISALKVGADLVNIVATEEAAPGINSYSPDLAVYPFLNNKSHSKITPLLQRFDVIVIGPGLNNDDETLTYISDIIKLCKNLQKPLVIDANGLAVVAKNPLIIKDYPCPGIILTPNHVEANMLMTSITNNSSSWYSFWGKYVSVLVKGEQDQFFTSVSSYNWVSSEGGSKRRVIGQGDILSGFLGTIFNWAIKQTNCELENQVQFSHSISAFAAAKLTRLCNSKAYTKYGRSMTPSDMIPEIHNAFVDVFVQ